MAVTYEFIDDGKSFVIKYKGQSYRAGKNDVELVIPNETNDNILKIRSNSAQLTDIEINLDEDTILGVGAGSTTATALDSALGAIFFLEEGGGSGGGQVNTVTAQSPLEDSGTVNKTIKLEDGSTNSSQLYWNGSAWVEIDLPYTVANDLVTFDRDVQIPQTSLLVGDAIKMSDLAQSLSYTTQFDAKEYIIMGYEITENGNQRPNIKSFSASSSFELQPLSDTTETFSGLISFEITSIQQVIGKTYRLNILSDTDLHIKLYRLAEGTGTESKIVDETIPASQTNLTGFDFDLTPIVDFEDQKVYRLEIDNGAGNGQIQGTLITGTNPYSVSPINVSPNFVPYIKRQVGWVYDNKDIAYLDDIVSGGGVETVNGDIGPNVVLDTDDITEGTTNKYITQSEKDQITTNTNSITQNSTDISTSIAAGLENKNDITDLENNKVSSIVAGTANVTIGGSDTNPSISVAQTTAGLLTNVYFTGDEVTTAEGTFYLTKISDRGTVGDESQTVILASNETKSFTQDYLGEPSPSDSTIVSGVYAAFPIMQVSSNQNNQRFKIEAYLCDSEGVPTGLGDGPLGTLGVNTVLIADSGIIDLQANNPTNVNCQGDVINAIPFLSGQRFRYVIIAERIGAGSQNKTVTFFTGNDYNSYFQIPNPSIVNGSSRAQYLISYAKAGLINNITVLETRSSFTIPTGKYFGGNTNAYLKGIKFTTGTSAANAASSFVLDVRYDDPSNGVQHVVGGGTLLKQQEMLQTGVALATSYNVSNEVLFDPIELVGDKVYFVDVSNMGFFTFTDLEVELLIETELSPANFLF